MYPVYANKTQDQENSHYRIFIVYPYVAIECDDVYQKIIES